MIVQWNTLLLSFVEVQRLKPFAADDIPNLQFCCDSTQCWNLNIIGASTLNQQLHSILFLKHRVLVT